MQSKPTSIGLGVFICGGVQVNAPRLPGATKFHLHLASRDFANFREFPTGNRPIYNASNAGELVRFVFQNAATNPNTISRIMEFGVPVSVFNLNSPTSTTALQAALATLNNLRPDPSHTEIEQLISAGNSFYRALTIESAETICASQKWLELSFRATTHSPNSLTTASWNTSDALVPGDFRAERARSLLDRRHRFVFSGVSVFRISACCIAPDLARCFGAPFNISIGGIDRSLDDVGNDRPNFHGDTTSCVGVRRGVPLSRQSSMPSHCRLSDNQETFHETLVMVRTVCA
jgi:hypothetical protein